MALTQEELDTAVRDAIVAALGLDADEVKPDATLLGELGAESIDLLDILFRLERKLGTKIQAADLSAYSDGAAGSLRIGTYQSVSARLLPTLIRRFKEAVGA